MRNLIWDRPTLARRYRDRFRGRPLIEPESRDLDEETELAFHKVWLARQLRSMPKPQRRRPVRLPRNAAAGVNHSIEGLRSACGLTPLPHRRPQ